MAVKPFDYTIKKLNSWKELNTLKLEFSAYVCRGQADANWQLCTSLERALSRYSEEKDYWISNEYWLLYEFKKRAHLYSNRLPDDKDILSWLALMQHHGAPTRLLDFTYSFYVACYFAVYHADVDSAVWLINESWLRKRAALANQTNSKSDNPLRDDVLEGIYRFGNKFLKNAYRKYKGRQEGSENLESGVLIIEPERQSQRLAAQQGLFLMQTDTSKSFEDNIENIKYIKDDADSLAIERCQEIKKNIVKVILKKELHREILSELKMMNITAETLFPGIDGFANSLVHTVVAT